MQERGIGAAADPALAEEILTALSAQDPPFPVEVALGFAQIDNPLRDPARAREWLRQGVEAGNADALWYYLIDLEDGMYGPTDPAEAARWREKMLAD